MNKLIYLVLLLTACTSPAKKPDKYASLYAQTADSLVKYKKEILEGREQPDSMFTDWTQLDYPAFQLKYKLEEPAMYRFIKLFEITYKIAATTRKMEENMRLSEKLDSL